MGLPGGWNKTLGEGREIDSPPVYIILLFVAIVNELFVYLSVVLFDSSGKVRMAGVVCLSVASTVIFDDFLFAGTLWCRIIVKLFM